ncbi:MAG: hypothetical protein ACRCY3_10705 [Sphingorhabdus sp.]
MRGVLKPAYLMWAAAFVLPVTAGSALFAWGKQEQTARHVLDPLSGAEIEAASNIVRTDGRGGKSPRFTFIALVEPDKAQVAAGKAIPRRAEVGVYDRAQNKVYEAVVDLATYKVTSWKHIPGAQPIYLDDDDAVLTDILSKDPQWIDTLRKRGIGTDMPVKITGLSLGDNTEAGKKGDRMMFAFAKIASTKNGYGGMVPNLAAYVNMTDGKVVKVVDQGGPLPRDDLSFEANPDGLTPKLRPWREANEITAKVDGQAIGWGPWQFHFAMHPREGLVLNTISLRDGAGKQRKVLHRASLSEMAVPYGDPDEGWHARNIFDAGETGMAKYGKTSLTPGVEAPINARFFDAVVNDEAGKPVTIPQAIGLYERSTGALWRHRGHGVPAHELVLVSYATIDNYDYGIQWVFREDGSLRVELELTGIMAAKAIEAGRDPFTGGPLCGTRVGEARAAPNHQHFFNFRLDFDVDGAATDSVAEVEGSGMPMGGVNKNGNVITTESRIFEKESDTGRKVDMATSRKWKVIDGTMPGAFGAKPGFVLAPGENALPFAAPGSSLIRRAGFVTGHMWVTPFAARERYAAGEYPFNGDGSDGLKAWTMQGRSVKNTDVVMWYTLGVTHLPRPEEWPIMPSHRASFTIMPAGFYSKNPVMAQAMQK